jgi:Tfp pilus assembly protein PilN
MPAITPSINLLGEQDLAHSPWGRILTWATTYGRYIMITTEIVVLLAFISRFSLDRKLTDLNEEIAQKQAIIEANSSFESEFRGLQERISTIKTLITSQGYLRDVLEELQQLLPLDVYLESLTLNDTTLTAQTTAVTTAGFSQFLSNVTQSRFLQNIEAGEVKRNPLTGIQFQLTATLVKGKR